MDFIWYYDEPDGVRGAMNSIDITHLGHDNDDSAGGWKELHETYRYANYQTHLIILHLDLSPLKFKDEEKLEPIWELDSSPTGGPGSGTGSGFFYWNRV